MATPKPNPDWTARQEKRIDTTKRRHGKRCYAKWAKMGWESPPPAKRKGGMNR